MFRTMQKVFLLLALVGFTLTPHLAFAEQIPIAQVQLDPAMTIQEAAVANEVTTEEIIKVLEAPVNVKPEQTVAEVLNGKKLSLVQTDLEKLIVEKKLEQNKNWPVIFTKLLLWLLIIIGSSFLLRLRLISRRIKLLFSAGVVLFLGFLLGSDPNPLGMIKDAAYIYGTTGVVFKPRIIVAVAILLTILIGSRLFCGWACHLGAWQELFYALPSKKYKLPFLFTNSIRVLSFAVIIVAGIGYGLDLFGAIDPFQIFNFNPAWPILAISGLLVLLSIFIYRPWCTLFCPLGLLAWVVNKFSLYRITYRPDLCTNCQACSRVCPTGRISAVVSGKNNDECYACGHCLAVCNHKALKYTTTKNASL